MFKMDLALNKLQGLICHKTKPNQIQTKYFPAVFRLRYRFLNRRSNVNFIFL